VNLNPGSSVEDMVSIRIWLDSERVVSTSRRQLRSVVALQKQMAQAGGQLTPGEFLLSLAARLGDYMSEAIEQIENDLEQAEDKIQDCKTIDRNSPFSRIRRQVARIRRYVAPQREALEHLSRSGLAPFRAEDLPGFREETNRLTLTLENLDLVRERAMVAQEEFLSLLAHEQNARMLLLSIIAAVFLPLSFLTGLMGMNVAGLPGTVSPAAFWIVSMIMLTIAAGILVLLRRRGWL
jgi:zinc transporter